MKQIGLKEAQQHLLNIAKEFDRICTQHDIPYYMVYGTMLGAVRHEGFIPWDDDMDFGVPYEYYEELIDILEKELQYPYRCCTYKNNPAVMFNYFKIEDQSTLVDEYAIALPLEKKLGINIDVYPLNRCNLGNRYAEAIRKRTLLLNSFTRSKGNKTFHRKITKGILRFLLGGKPIYLQRSIDKLLKKVNDGNRIGNILGAGDQNTVPVEWYGNGKRYQFENASFLGPENYHDYLSHIFCDYMTLPPEDERRPHTDLYYLRD